MTIAPQRTGSRHAPAATQAPATNPADEQRTLAEVAARIETVLGSLNAQWRAISPPDHGPQALRADDVLELVGDFVRSGGKRLRPRMTYWGWVAGGGARRDYGRADVVTAGAALELLHAFALVHDDVMDESQQRRGQPSVHVRATAQHAGAAALGDSAHYGASLAILVGDLIHSEADSLAATLPGTMRAAWRTLSVELMAGQARDLVGAAAGPRDLAHARQIAAMKSGAYTVWRPLQLGALAAQASPETLTALQRFGRHLGEAFALRDDVLGVLGDPAVTGKPAGDDIVAGKPTVLLALADQLLPSTWRFLLRRAGTGQCRPEEAAEIAHALVEFGVIDEVEAMIANAVRAGSNALDDPSIEPVAAAGLRALAQRVAGLDA